jgi:hypothetical protein
METQNKFVHDLVFPDRAGDGRHLRVLRHLVYEMLTVKAADFMTPYATGHNCYAVHIGFEHHMFPLWR